MQIIDVFIIQLLERNFAHDSFKTHKNKPRKILVTYVTFSFSLFLSVDYHIDCQEAVGEIRWQKWRFQHTWWALKSTANTRRWRSFICVERSHLVDAGREYSGAAQATQLSTWRRIRYFE